MRKRYSTKHPVRVLSPVPAGPENCHGARRVRRGFCLPIAIGTGTNFIKHYECRGTRLIGSRKQVKVYKVLLRALARSRYKFLQICQGSRSIPIAIGSKNRDELVNCPCYGPGLIYLSRHQKIVSLYNFFLSDYILFICLVAVILLCRCEGGKF